MYATRIRPKEIRQLSRLTDALLEDSELMAQLSVIQLEQVRSAAEIVRSLVGFVDSRELNDSLNEG